jgi:3-methyl-2-oxobutanoate hydroxymethyltransferase
MGDQQKNSNGPRKVTVNDIILMKEKGEKITALTSYDLSTATFCDKSGVDIVLVGDSAGMVMLGYKNTVPVNMEEMLLFTKAVCHGTKRAFVTADMPFGSYQINNNLAVENAIRLIKTGCDSVKLEGGKEVADTVSAIVKKGIPVMGHIGLKPQTSTLWEGYKVQGKTKDSALKLISDARALEDAGAFSIVLEMVTSEVAKIITEDVSVPTIGIGSGFFCDGQVLVIHDMLGIYENMKPRFVKRYLELSSLIPDAITRYIVDVKSSKFPEEQNIFHMVPDEYLILQQTLKETDNEKQK